MAQRGRAGASVEMVFDSTPSNRQSMLQRKQEDLEGTFSVLLIWYEQRNFCSISRLKCPPKICAGKTFLSHRIIMRQFQSLILCYYGSG